jgi:pyrroloquinoline quinone biosynthesis protein E
MSDATSDLPDTAELADSCRPRLAPGVRMQIDRLTGRPLLLFPEAVVELRGSGSAIVPLCDGSRLYREILATLAQRFQVPPGVLRCDVTRYLTRLHQRMLVQFDDAAVCEPAAADVPAPASSPVPSLEALLPGLPRAMGLIAELTYRCPLHCPYCSNPAGESSGGVELTTAEWRRVLGEAAELGVLHALLSGGEPLLRRDLESLVAGARDFGLYVNLITSAVGFTEERARSLKKAGLDSVQISFQADLADLADSIAGTKAHARKLEAARIACDHGFPLTINVVLHRLNIDRVHSVIEMAELLGARRLELASAQYYGWAMRNRSVLLPSRSQVAEAGAAASLAQHRLKGLMDVLYVLPDYFDDRPKPCMNGWGKQYLAVNPKGAVLPCPTAGEIKSLRFDNVREHSLSWIWANSDAFNRFRGTNWMPLPCQTCDRREIDFGGCRCQAALVTGDAANTDPVCSLSPHRPLIDEALSAAAAGQPPTIGEFVFRTNPDSSCTS